MSASVTPVTNTKELTSECLSYNTDHIKSIILAADLFTLCICKLGTIVKAPT